MSFLILDDYSKKQSIMKENSFFTFLAGAAVGAVLGLMFAPERGEVIRRRVKDAAKGGCNAAHDALNSLEEALAETLEESEAAQDAGGDGKEGKKIEIA